MSAREELNAYIGQVERRLRTSVALRGAAILAGSALATTVVLVLIVNSFAFSRGSVGGARAVLLCGLLLIAGFSLAIPLWRLNRRGAVGRAESLFPQFEQRLITFAERDQDGGDPFLELLAADTLQEARSAEPARMAPGGGLLALTGAGVASLGVLVWLILAGPGFLGYGASLLWAGARPTPFYAIHVTPGNITVRRNADQLVTALPVGVQTNRVRLYARFQSASKWEQVAMQPQPGASGFQFLFAGLPEGLEYYVQAGAVRSRHYRIQVVDMPSVKRIRVVYHYPGWAGLRDVTEEQGGDLRAVQGTRADLAILTDRPLRDGMLVLDNGQTIPLSGGQGNVYKGSIAISKDGLYHVAALDRGQAVRLSGDYFIAANPPNPPEIAIARPGRDYRASPIEEVTVSVKADDDYGLDAMDLHYSVNGGPEKTANLLKQKGLKQADGSTVLSLENFKLVPGDVVSLYATAKDARSDARTDIFFIQADPFEREFTQSQAAGGGGGGGGGGQGGQDDISQREKEIIAATWKQQGDKSGQQQQAAASAKFLSEVQAKLADQARSLSDRMQSRDLSDANEEFNSFVKDMNTAAQAMDPASDKLKDRKWSAAMPDEQKALQYLQRAEATFRQIEVAFGSRGGGGGGGAGRDLASLFDLELDTEKNQYETAQSSSSSSANQGGQQVDDALRKLDELARRQQELADQQRNSAQGFQQRWQQELLRRNAEELEREMEQQLARNSAAGGQSSSQSSSQSGSASSSASSSSASSSSAGGQSSSGQAQSASDSRTRQALDRLRQAAGDMGGASAQQQAEAAERLREATDLLGGVQKQQATGRLDSMARESDRLSKEQQAQAERMRQVFGQLQGAESSAGRNPSASVQELGQLANDRQGLSDDLSRLRKQMQDAERELAPTQRSAASKLRDALGEMEQNDLTTRTQRSADWLRRGINPTSNATESDIGSGLQQLSRGMHEAQQALGSGGDQQGTETALDQVRRLRDQLQAFQPGSGRLQRGGQAGQSGQSGQSGQPGGNNQMGQAGQIGRGGQAGGNQPGANQAGANQAGRNAAGGYGEFVRGGGGDRNGQPVYGGLDTGNNSNLPQPVAPAGPAPAGDSERTIQQGLSELNQLQQAERDDPETLRQVQELIREMQGLDPRRFPGNPAMVEQLHAQVLRDVDKLEVSLKKAKDDQQTGKIRSTDTDAVPAGYEDAVAEYFRRLSKTP